MGASASGCRCEMLCAPCRHGGWQAPMCRSLAFSCSLHFSPPTRELQLCGELLLCLCAQQCGLPVARRGKGCGTGTWLPENWCFMWVAWWAWDTACGLSTLQPFPARWVMTSQVFPAGVELSSKAMGSIGPLEGHEAFEPPSCLHASYPPAPGEDPGGTVRVLKLPCLPWASGRNNKL